MCFVHKFLSPEAPDKITECNLVYVLCYDGLLDEKPLALTQITHTVIVLNRNVNLRL